LADFEVEWERCKPLLKDALAGLWTLDAVEQEIREGRAVLWPLERSAVVTQIHSHPNGRVLRLWLAGGEMVELMRYMPAVDNYALAQGCIAVEIEGRPGWERVLKDYTKRRVILVKEL
jgi:hypothetical protein